MGFLSFTAYERPEIVTGRRHNAITVHHAKNIAREASAAPAASFKRLTGDVLLQTDGNANYTGVWYIVRTAVRWFAGICLFTIGISFAALGQVGTVPTKWIGTWKLNIKKSTFGTVLVPGVPADFKILSQTMSIEQAANGIRISGDSTFFAGGGSSTTHDDLPLRLDGTPTNLANASFSFRQIDNSAFEIISTLNVPNTNVGEVSRYVFSSDGSKVTATKIQTERALVPTGTDKSKGAMIRTSKFILVYDKAEHE